MKDLTTLNAAEVQSMSSKEIAELTGKKHFHVIRDIEALLESLNPDLDSGFKSTTYLIFSTNPHHHLSSRLVLPLYDGDDLSISPAMALAITLSSWQPACAL